MMILLLWLLLFESHSCENIHKFFEEINEKAKIFNSIGADIAWQSSLEPNKDGYVYLDLLLDRSRSFAEVHDNERTRSLIRYNPPQLVERAAKYQHRKIAWQHATCRTLSSMHDRLVLNSTQERQAYLLCRGPKYYYKEAREMSVIYEELQSIYTNIEVCIPDSENTANLTDIETAILIYISTGTDYLENSQENAIEFAAKMAINGGKLKKEIICLKGETDFEKIMEFSRKPEVLEWVWSVWREKVKRIRKPYSQFVDLENKAARRNGYRDIGDSWRDELELPNLRAVCHQLYRSIKPLYTLLHGVVRFYLRREYGDAVEERGPIPAHLLGNLWSHNWEPLAELILPKVVNLDDRIKGLRWTVEDMNFPKEDVQIMFSNVATKKDVVWVVTKNYDVHSTALTLLKKPKELLAFVCNANNQCAYHVLMKNTFNKTFSLDEILFYSHHYFTTYIELSSIAIKRAEDFYISLGLPPMTKTFWRQSVLSRENHEMARCHGTAADMFQDGDFRLLYCSGVTFEDFYVIHHEMGHIQYYMAYEKQPVLFRQANTALHESIGDTIMYSVITPQHLHRLRLINDSELYTSNTIKNNMEEYIAQSEDEGFKTTTKVNEDKTYTNDKKEVTAKIYKNYEEYNKANEEFKGTSDKNDDKDDFNNRLKEYNKCNPKVKAGSIKNNKDEVLDSITMDEILMLKQALNKLPQIPFSLLMEEYRWKYFEGSLDKKSLNQEFWEMASDLQGIAPPSYRGEGYFDVGANFHVPDNTPYIRYFLSSFLQHQLFESLCKAAVYGHRNVKDPLPDTISLNRCDLYGSKAAGTILKDIMSRGASQNWQQILQETTGKTGISAVSLQRYYRPLYKLLKRLVGKYDIPIGW